MRLEEYFFADRYGRPIIGDAHVAGKVYGSAQYEDGKQILSSYVLDFGYDDSDKIVRVVTKSGSLYELGSVHPDYSELRAVYEAGEDVLEDWTLYKVHLGYKILGKKMGAEGTIISGVIVGQNGNYITILSGDEATPRTILVCWPHMAFKTSIKLSRGSLERIPYDREHFEEAFGVLCRPRFF